MKCDPLGVDFKSEDKYWCVLLFSHVKMGHIVPSTLFKSLQLSSSYIFYWFFYIYLFIYFCHFTKCCLVCSFWECAKLMNPEATVGVLTNQTRRCWPPLCQHSGLSHFFSQHSRELNQTELCDDTSGSVVYLCFFSRVPLICCWSRLVEQQQDTLTCAMSGAERSHLLLWTHQRQRSQQKKRSWWWLLINIIFLCEKFDCAN